MEDDADAVATQFDEVFLGEFGHISAFKKYLSSRRVVEAAQKVQQGRLAGAGTAYKGDELSMVDVEGQLLDRDYVFTR